MIDFIDFTQFVISFLEDVFKLPCWGVPSIPDTWEEVTKWLGSLTCSLWWLIDWIFRRGIPGLYSSIPHWLLDWLFKLMLPWIVEWMIDWGLIWVLIEGGPDSEWDWVIGYVFMWMILFLGLAFVLGLIKLLLSLFGLSLGPGKPPTAGSP